MTSQSSPPGEHKSGRAVAWIGLAAAACAALSVIRAVLNIGYWVFLALVVVPFAYKYYDKKGVVAAVQEAAMYYDAVALASAPAPPPPPPPPPEAASMTPQHTPAPTGPRRQAAPVSRGVDFPAPLF